METIIERLTQGTTIIREEYPTGPRGGRGYKVQWLSDGRVALMTPWQTSRHPAHWILKFTGKASDDFIRAGGTTGVWSGWVSK